VVVRKHFEVRKAAAFNGREMEVVGGGGMSMMWFSPDLYLFEMIN
jgi:hypothetical protein